MNHTLDHLKIKHLRIRKGWTQQQLADICEVSIRTIQRVEREGNASIDTLSALSSVLEVPREEFYLLNQQTVSPRARTGLFLLMLMAFIVGLGLGGCIVWLAISII